jgi:RNA polymerase sigma factor for flagellar operon FliA
MRDAGELWRRYKQKGDARARQEIIGNYAYLAKYVVDRMLIRPNSVVGYDDLLGHAIVGLIDAVDRFDTSKGVKFETYGITRIRGAVLDALKSLDWAPRSVRKSEAAMKRAFASLEARLGRPATDAEVAGELGISTDEFNDVLVDVGQSALLSLEDMIVGDQSSWLSKLAGQAGPDTDPMLAAELSERKHLIARAIDSLPDREKLVISLYYKEDMTLKEIGAVLGITESRVCQLHSKAVVRLYAKLAGHGDLLLSAA